MNNQLVLFIVLMAVITFLTRFPMLYVSSRVHMPAWLQRGLALVPVGVFSSLTIPPILFHAPGGTWNPEYLVAGAVALAAGMWSRQIVVSLLTGVIVIIIWRSLVGLAT